MATTFVLFGPSLPARDAVAHELAAALPAGTRFIVDELRTARERRALARGLAMTGERVAYLSWSCAARDAERDIYHHFSAVPDRYAEARWKELLSDLTEREPPRGEVAPVFEARAGEPLASSIAELKAWIGPGAAPVHAAPHVLVVEDDPGQRVVLEEALLELGCDVVTSATAEEALRLASTERFDLVVADHGLPGASGAALARALASIRPELHVAIVTGQPELAIDRLGARKVDVVLAKPVGIVDLIRLVDSTPAAPGRSA